MIPQLIILVLMAISFGIDLARHGKPKEGNHNAGITLVSFLISLGLLYWGGFFDPFFK